MERIQAEGDDSQEETVSILRNTISNGDETTTNESTWATCKRVRVWNTLHAVFTIFLCIDAVVSVIYIYTRRPPQTLMDTRIVSEKLLNATLPLWRPLPDATHKLTKIAFGSCSSQEMPQPQWDTVTKYGPDLFLLAGDNVYGDCTEETCHHLRQAYKDMAEHPSVQGAAPHLAVFATLDDHDYGLSSCHGGNPYKETARELFAEFFHIPATEFAAKDGVYRSAIWGGPGERLQVILLDTRYARSPFIETGNPESPFSPDYATNVQMLSDKQWRWLEARLHEPADLRLIVSSIQVLNNGTGFEAWRQLPAERDRFYRLIQGKSVVLLTGDRHVGGFYESGSLIEVTASSFTHTVPLGEAFTGYCATPVECDERDPTRIGDSVRKNHFGSIEIDWENHQFEVALRRTESTPGSMYTNTTTKHAKISDAGQLLGSRSYSFPF